MTATRSSDQQWRLLGANDPDVVLTTLTEAFGDNEAAVHAPTTTSGTSAVRYS